MSRSRAGFTLIELMVVVAILGVLAAVAIPSFSIYMKRTKSAEAPAELKQLFQRASVYYTKERADPGVDGEHRNHCIVGPANSVITPTDIKQPGDYGADEWTSLAYSASAGYFRYEIISGGARCGVDPLQVGGVYTLRALGDLDGDGVQSTFDLAVGSNAENELYQARSFHIVNDYE
jgi:prepilin-type N-terminal cleavage/methylation domain-containing protein